MRALQGIAAKWKESLLTSSQGRKNIVRLRLFLSPIDSLEMTKDEDSCKYKKQKRVPEGLVKDLAEEMKKSLDYFLARIKHFNLSTLHFTFNF